MKSVHLVIPDLLLPGYVSAGMIAELELPVLEKWLARGSRAVLQARSLECLLCELFKVEGAVNAPVAPISAAFDGLGKGYWLRADPVHLSLQRDQMRLSGVPVSAAEANQFCTSLNEYYSGEGMEYFAPHPLRWYVKLSSPPRLNTVPLSAVMGGNVRGVLPAGKESARWNQLSNEIQMLFYEHPLNQKREIRGELPVNSLWFWGGGEWESGVLPNPYNVIQSDDVLAEMFASAAGIPFMPWQNGFRLGEDKQLLLWSGLRSALQLGNLDAWRDQLQHFESAYAQPLWQALLGGKIDQIQLDMLGDAGMIRVVINRGDSRAFWRRSKRLATYALV